MDELDYRESDPKIHPSARLSRVRLGRYCEISERVRLTDVDLGDFSYFDHDGEAIYCQIGRFCSIAAHVRINALAHPTERLTTHKISYRPNEYFRFMPLDKAFRQQRIADMVTIGHDVWIGHGAVILPKISIGSGSVIGANAVVTRNVTPYEVVAGAPARMLRKRFKDSTIAQLLDMRWWDWPLDKIRAAVFDMQTLPIDAFIAQWRDP